MAILAATNRQSSNTEVAGLLLSPEAPFFRDPGLISEP